MISEGLANMMAGEALKTALISLPEYDEMIRTESDAIRLMKLDDLYNVYLPSDMSFEIYSKLYLAMLRSLKKKESKLAVKQRNENFRAIQQGKNNGIIGGSDSFTIIGTSGIGKSSAIDRAVSLITGNQLIETQNPYSKIVPCLVTQCPFDCSVKGLLLEILRNLDDWLGSKYYENAVRARATTDMLIGNVSQTLLNHVGLLVVDEIQNICNHRNGNSLVAVLTQLINNSGISICMVGTPESSLFFERALQLARRSLGLRYSHLSYDKYFREFCMTLFGLQYVRKRSEVSEAIIDWLYEHSGGIISIVVSLIHDAQEIAILDGREVLSLETLNAAYQQRLNMLHGYLKPDTKLNRPSKKKNLNPLLGSCEITVEQGEDYISIVEMAKKSKLEKIELIDLLQEKFTVVEVIL